MDLHRRQSLLQRAGVWACLVLCAMAGPLKGGFMRTRRGGQALVAFTRVVVSPLVSLAGIEAACRWLDGFRVDALRLTARADATPAPPVTTKYVEKIGLAAGIEPAWFLRDPPGFPRPPVDPGLLRRASEPNS